ncbi:MAG: helix-hairpin-helix domain-containing protein [Acutalibacteraceae bacterium]|nr:helix-hairpin-helix domain-containing protein [Acutalibacteraceae bacterium]
MEGVGKGLATKLLKHFGSIEKIKKANFEEILKVKGIPRKTAENIINYFKSN